MIRQPLQMAVGRAPKQGQQVNSRLWDIVVGDVLTGVFWLGAGVFDRNRLPGN
jgi:hypothetical protein